MKKVLFLIDNLAGGGAEKVLTTLANGLSGRFEVTVQTLFDEGVYRDALDEKVRYQPGFSHCGKNFRRVMQRLMKYMPAGLLYRWLIREGYDCQIAFLEGATTKILSGGETDVRRIAWVHTDLVAFPGSCKAFYPTQKALHRAYHSYDRVACVSAQAKQALEQVVPGLETVQVVYNPVDAAEIQSHAQTPGAFSWEKTRFAFCAVGRMVEQKGFDRLLTAAARLKEEGFNFEVLLFGTGMLEQKLQAQAKQLGLEETVRFAGFSPNAPYYVGKADAYLCTSRAEGFSLTVAEALILGTPVISTDCTGPRELLDGGEYGLLTENSEEGIYAGMKQVLEDPGLLAQLGEKASRRQAFFDVEKTYDRVSSLIEGTL